MNYVIMKSELGDAEVSSVLPFLLELRGSLFKVHPWAVPSYTTALFYSLLETMLLLFSKLICGEGKELERYFKTLGFQTSYILSTEIASDLTVTHWACPLGFVFPY